MSTEPRAQREKSRVELWVEEHRELVLLAAVLPLGKAVTVYQRALRRLRAPTPSGHQQRVERVVADVRRYAELRRRGAPEGQVMLRTDRKGTDALNTRVADKDNAARIAMHDLRAILGVDHAAGTVRVEPFVTIGEVAAHLDAQGLQLEATIEMEGATLGGLVLAIGMTTHSHVCGLMHDIVEAYELVTASGELLRVTRDGEHADLFRALPFSQGTLGLLVALSLRVVPAPTHVRLVYRPFFDLDEYCAEHERLLRAQDPPWFLEAQVFGRDRAVILEGHLATSEEVASGALPINDVNHWNKPFFFKHVESMLDRPAGTCVTELVPTYAFLMRHERSMCMTMGQIIPTANEAWFRHSLGWTLPPNMPLLKGSRPPEERARAMRRQVYQDFAFPAEHLRELLTHLDDTFQIYPLLVYPCRVVDRGGMVRVPGQHGVPWDGRERHGLYLNLGIYGPPRAIREGDLRYPTVTKVRELEALVRARSGFLHTYVDVLSTEAEFEAMFDHTLWRQMRARYGADGVFPTVFEKIRPELDIAPFLAEEATWLASP
ncbi:MAG: FAD-binding oxidoreductase [Myxococcales bacterium]|nr:FAD-binding oxidoreductase [Myxococcales bacterium]